MNHEDALRATFARESLPPPEPTCAACHHVERCRFLLGPSFHEDSVQCDWQPSRFAVRVSMEAPAPTFSSAVDPPRTYHRMPTYTGGWFHPDDPIPREVNLLDIAHALSNLCRYAGHTRNFYSVAQHSVIVSLTVPQAQARWGLLHDAAEAYLGDLIRPVKHICGLMEEYQRLERSVMMAVVQRFGLDPKLPPADVVDADELVAETEMRDLLTRSPLGAGTMTARAGGLARPIVALPPRDAERMFLDRADELGLPVGRP